MSKFKFIQLAPEGRDCTAPYDVDFIKPATVGEFIEEILTRKEWGFIEIHKSKKSSILGIPQVTRLASIGYKNDTLNTHIPEDILNKQISIAYASGGWTRMDYKIVIEED